MAIFDRLPQFARLQFLGKYQEPGRFVAAGMAVGLLLFLVWWVFQPSFGTHASVGATAGSGQSAEPSIGDGSGVLDGITGAPEPGARGVAEIASAQEQDQDQEQEQGRGVGDASAGLNPDGDPYVNDDAQADTGGQDPDLRDAPMDSGQARSGSIPQAGDVTLVPFYVEVDRGQGVSEVLRIDAVSPGQALAILRDYRGDPHVLRGPTTQPLD
ncbi:MAG: hypothetical protein ABIP44_13260 [Pseudoxanthomonas sp.]